MFTEKHVLTNPYNNHRLSRTVTGYDVTAIDCNVSKTSGYNNSVVNLTPLYPERFQNWTITGASITGSAFSFDNSDVTASAQYSPAKFSARLGCSSDNTYYGVSRPYDIVHGYSGSVLSSEIFDIATVTGYSGQSYPSLTAVYPGAILFKEGVNFKNVGGIAYVSANIDIYGIIRVKVGQTYVLNTASPTAYYQGHSFTAKYNNLNFTGSGTADCSPWLECDFGTGWHSDVTSYVVITGELG